MVLQLTQAYISVVVTIEYKSSDGCVRGNQNDAVIIEPKYWLKP